MCDIGFSPAPSLSVHVSETDLLQPRLNNGLLESLQNLSPTPIPEPITLPAEPSNVLPSATVDTGIDNHRVKSCRSFSISFGDVVAIAIRDAEQFIAKRARLLTVKVPGAKEAFQKAFMTTIKTCVEYRKDGTTYVRTGDLDYMWLRDASAQV